MSISLTHLTRLLVNHHSCHEFTVKIFMSDDEHLNVLFLQTNRLHLNVIKGYGRRRVSLSILSLFLLDFCLHSFCFILSNRNYYNKRWPVISLIMIFISLSITCLSLVLVKLIRCLLLTHSFHCTFDEFLSRILMFEWDSITNCWPFFILISLILVLF